MQVEYALCEHFHVRYVGKAVKYCDCMPELVVCQNMSCNVYSITLYINNMTDLQNLLLEFISFACVTEASNVEPKKKLIENEQFHRCMQSVQVCQHMLHEMLWFINTILGSC
jgi:hypothetical protein